MLSKEEKEEAKLNVVGKKILKYSGIGFGVFTIIAMITNAGIAWMALIATSVGTAIGIGMCANFRSEEKIIKANIESKRKAGAMVAQMVNNNFNTSFLYEDSKKKNSGTKEIVKDAVIGGVIAGPAGAVVGAIVGKDKADKKR